MSSPYVRHYSTKSTPQDQPIPGRSMTPNSAGGFSFAVDMWKRLERFLILGSEGGSYYASERKLTVENAENVRRCLEADAGRALETIATISESGRAPRNDPAEFALAAASAFAPPDAKSRVRDYLPRVCRTGGQLLHFVEAADGLRGWGTSLRRAVAGWYEDKPARDLAFQVLKYQRRDGWSHVRALQRVHPRPTSPEHQAIYRWIAYGADGLGPMTTRRRTGADSFATRESPDVSAHLPAILAAAEEAKTAPLPRVLRLIADARLPREAIRTEHLNSPEVWEALLQHMPPAAMIRNLGKMTSIGLAAPLSDAARRICDVLRSPEAVTRARLHPLAVLQALQTYNQGHGDEGSLSWSPVPQIVAALDGAFYLAFGSIEPANKRTLLALDVSGSMGMHSIAGSTLTPRDGAAVMAMATARVEPDHHLMAFAGRLVPLDVTAADSLETVIRKTSRLPFGATDCALPMTTALANRWDVDVFGVYTDSETWHGPIHPAQALQQYRRERGVPARMFVCAMVSNGFTIADPDDAGQLDVVGFDASTPRLIADFSADRL